MSKSNGFEGSLLDLIFLGTAIPDLAENDVTSPLTALQISLHTAFPGEAGDQESNEAAYTGYARAAVARSGTGWTRSGNQIANVAAITFPQATGGSEELAYFGVGAADTGAGSLYYWGPLGSLLGPAILADPAGDTVTVQNHGLSAGDCVAFFAGPGQALPGEITEGTVYWVVGTPTADGFQISATEGGAAVNYATDGDATAFKMTPLVVSAGITPEFAAGALVIQED